jgi:hypothetical protein
MMRLRLLTRLSSFVVCSALSLYAQNGSAGTRAFEFLSIDNNARTVAMGGAAVGMPNGLNGVFTNPAICGFVNKTQAMFGYNKILLDLWAGPMGYAMPYRNYGVFAASMVYMSHGYLNGDEALDEEGNPTGVKWHVFSLVGNLTWSKIIYPQLSIGFSVKGIHHAIESSQEYHENAQGVAFDAGVQYRGLDSRFIVGGAVENAGFLVNSFSEQADNLRLPVSVAIGVSYVPMHMPSLRLACDLQKTNDDFLTYKPGFEAAVYRKNLFIRGGYGFSQPDIENAIKTLRNEADDNYMKSSSSGLSLGVGFITEIKGILTNIDLAYLGRVSGINPSFLLTILFEY